VTRRSLLLAGATAMAASRGFAQGTNRGRIASRLGIQAGVVRAALTRDFDGTLKRLADIGYTAIEWQWYGGNFGRTPSQLRVAVARAGLRAPSALVHAGTMLVGWERHIAAAKEAGLECLAVVNLTEDERQSMADWHEWADRFNRAGEIARKAGLWLALHNEPGFMDPIDGRIPYDAFVERTDPALVALELDVGNLTRAGHDPVAYLRKYPNRYRFFHLKDLPPAGTEGDRELGAGRVDLRRILSAVPHPDEASFFVEHRADPDAPFESVRRSFDHIAKLDV
jgi:sugar phosphate isomerase/epimerase